MRTRRIRRRLYRVVRALGISVERAHRWALRATMRTAIPKDDVIELFKSAGCSLLRADTVTVMPPGFDDTTFYFTKP